MERVALTGLVILRWAALVWVAVVFGVGDDELRRPFLAFVLIGAAFAYTAVVTLRLRPPSDLVLRRPLLAIEFAIAVGLVVCDGWAYEPGHAFAGAQTLGSIWPLAAILSIGFGLGTAWGAGAGALVGLGRFFATYANGVRAYDGGRILSLINTTVFFVVAGALAGYVMVLMRRAEREISAARAREELARDLHDGVLQTLAIVQRRSDDADLVRLAREQDRDLRNFLYGNGQRRGRPGDLGTALRDVAARFEDVYGVRAQVLVPGDLPSFTRDEADAISRAVGEALNNAGKHAHARKVTIFVEPGDDSRVFCSVKDDGAGFDVSTNTPGVGITQSIVQRMREVGGHAELRSQIGQGTEVCLWL